MTNFIKNFWNDEEGATAIEYGLIAGLIAVAIIVAATTLGTNMSNIFCGIANVLKNLGTANNTFSAGACS